MPVDDAAVVRHPHFASLYYVADAQHPVQVLLAAWIERGAAGVFLGTTALRPDAPLGA